MGKKKTKFIFNIKVQFEKIHVKGEADKHIYLRQLVQTNTSSELEIKRRISLG